MWRWNCRDRGGAVASGAAAPHRELTGLARVAPVAGGRGGAAAGRRGRPVARADRRGQDRSGRVPAAVEDGFRGLARYLAAVPVSAQGAAEQPAAPPGTLYRMARTAGGALAR